MVRRVESSTAAFWSYVQADDADELGRITSLATRLRAAYRLRTAETLSLFVDRTSLAWGDEWAKRIDNAIAGTTFFIPIITPSYFKSEACRRELLKFAREADRFGLGQLLMPVYWMPVVELDVAPEESADEAVVLVSRHQWQDLRTVRLEDESSSAFRKAVDGLAAELARRTLEVNASVDDLPADSAALVVRASKAVVADAEAEDPLQDDEPGFLEKLAASEDAWPEITEVMEAIGTEIEKIGDLMADATARIAAADARGTGIKARLAITEAVAHKLGRPAETIEELGYRYATLMTTLDAGVLALLEMAESADREGDDELQEFFTNTKALVETSDGALTSLQGMVDSAVATAKYSRSLRSPVSKMRNGLRGVIDGRTIVEEWGRRATALESQLQANDPVVDHDPSEH